MSPLFIPRSEVSQSEPEAEEASGSSGSSGPSGTQRPSSGPRPARPSGRTGPGAYEGRWTIDRAEDLLVSLTGVLSARVVADKEGEVEEIHVLTTTEVTPKQTVRNVESALLAHLDLEVDHRKISVAQTHPGPNLKPVSAAPSATSATAAASATAPAPLEEAGAETSTGAAPAAWPPTSIRAQRIVLIGHEVDAVGPRELRVRVQVQWAGGDRFEGTAIGVDLPKSRLDMVSRATLRALESCVKAEEGCDGAFTMALDGVRELDAFERRYVLVSVHAITGREVTALAGSAGVSDSPERAVILATLQASDRWVRGRVQYPAERGR